MKENENKKCAAFNYTGKFQTLVNSRGIFPFCWNGKEDVVTKKEDTGRRVEIYKAIITDPQHLLNVQTEIVIYSIRHSNKVNVKKVSILQLFKISRHRAHRYFYYFPLYNSNNMKRYTA